MLIVLNINVIAYIQNIIILVKKTHSVSALHQQLTDCATGGWLAAATTASIYFIILFLLIVFFLLCFYFSQ